ncbi:MAG: hypothetical protein H7Z21_09900 [Hymenobacter sp.]|nr:hypothetical protein [Hymenobacter sp.]
MNKTILSAAAVFLLLGSCQKDGGTIPQLDGNYETDTTVVPATIQFYTTGGKRITDLAAIKSFIRRQRVDDYFSFGNQQIPANNSVELIVRADKVTLVTKQPNQPNDTTETEITAKSQEHLTLTLIAESRVFRSTSNSSFSNCEELGSKIKTVYPAYPTCQALSPATGYSSLCTIRPVRVLSLQDGKPVLTLLSWVVKASRRAGAAASECSLAYSNEWNTFNSSLPAQLVGGDTIMVQAKEINLVKR